MDEKKITTRVKIGENEFTISSTADEEYVKRVADYVDKKLMELTRNDKRLSTAMAAILTSVNIADDYFRAREDGETLRGQLLRYADEAGKLKAQNQKLGAENKRLSDENKKLQLMNAKLEGEIKQQGKSGKSTKEV